MARMKKTVRKQVVKEDKPHQEKNQELGKVSQVDTKTPRVKKARRFRPGTKALREIRKF